MIALYLFSYPRHSKNFLKKTELIRKFALVWKLLLVVSEVPENYI